MCVCKLPGRDQRRRRRNAEKKNEIYWQDRFSPGDLFPPPLVWEKLKRITHPRFPPHGRSLYLNVAASLSPAGHRRQRLRPRGPLPWGIRTRRRGHRRVGRVAELGEDDGEHPAGDGERKTLPSIAGVIGARLGHRGHRGRGCNEPLPLSFPALPRVTRAGEPGGGGGAGLHFQ